MRSLAAVVLTLVNFYGLALAQPLRAEEGTHVIAQTAQSGLDNQAVADVYAITSQFERILVLRFKYQTDLLVGLEDMVRKEKIQNAVILAGIGSVRAYHFHVVSNRTLPAANAFIRDTMASADIASLSGYIVDGRVHAHIVLSDAGKAFGGHLEQGTRVFTFAIVTLGVFKEGANLRRIDDQTYR